MKQIDSFANRLKEYMRSHGNMTYEQLSELTGYPAQTLNRYALGQRIPKIDDFANIAIKLNVDPLWLQGLEIEESSTPAEAKEELRKNLIQLGLVDSDKKISEEEYERLSAIIAAFLQK